MAFKAEAETRKMTPYVRRNWALGTPHRSFSGPLETDNDKLYVPEKIKTKNSIGGSTLFYFFNTGS